MRFNATVYRTVDPRWAWDPLSGEGARIFGGRFNPVGIPALYTSLTYEGAMRERIGMARTQPVVTCEYEVDVEPIFNALDENDRMSFGISLEDLQSPNWEGKMKQGLISPSHKAAERLREAGYAGLLVQSFTYSAMPGDTNLVLWEYGNTLPRKVAVVDDENVLEQLKQAFDRT